MPDASTIAKFITETGPLTLFVVGLLWIILRLGSLWITKWFDKVVPVQERGVEAIQSLAESAKQFIEVQRETNDKFDIGIHVLGSRVKTLEQKAEPDEHPA